MDELRELIQCDAEFKLDDIDGRTVLFYAAIKTIIPVWCSIYMLRTFTLT